jgi:2,4-dienoyl-CoA reductase-like NADH-dependent reductase (Old Yellow Enzyme family)
MSQIRALFEPFTLNSLTLQNRIVMAPMTRAKSPDGIPGPDVAAYYRRRAEGGVGLIVTEGTLIPHPGAGFTPGVPYFYGEASLTGWRRVVEEVHQAGGKIFPQLWHVGRMLQPGEVATEHAVGAEMPQAEIDRVIGHFGEAARSAHELGFDGLEIHGAHGYLIDQFFWEGTNRRSDAYGGDLVARTRFAVEVIREIRRQVGPDFAVVFRFSQWKQQDFSAKLAHTALELERFLAPLAGAGVDIFHCSTRRYWEPEFEGSELNLAGWTKKITGKPTITVGAVSVDREFIASFSSHEASSHRGLDDLVERLERGEFDLVAVGRALIANPNWPNEIARGSLTSLRPFDRSQLSHLH